MSRGPGRVQKALLREVESCNEFGRPELWLCVTLLDLGLGEHPESRRRAAHHLAALGEIELAQAVDYVPSQSDWFASQYVRRTLLFARQPYGPAQQLHAAELREEYEENLSLWLDPQTGSLERGLARKWLDWYEAMEKRLVDLGGDAVLVGSGPDERSRLLGSDHRLRG